MESKFDFQEEYVVNEISKSKAKLVLLQLPEGLKQEAIGLVKSLETKTKAEIIVSGETCWGGCDLAIDEAKNLNADLIIHYGHAPFVKKADFPIVYVEMKDRTPIYALLEKSKKDLMKFKKLGLVCSVQHMHQLEETKNFFENLGKKVIIPSKKGTAYYDGHVVGCEYNSLKFISKDVDAFLVIGNQFHSLGAALAVKNPVYLINTYNQEIIDMTKLKDKVIRQRFAAIEKFKESNKIGIIVGTKPGQRFGNFKVIKTKLGKTGKECVIITMNEITKDKLVNFHGINAFVELACPRIAVEDYEKYEQTLITFKEALVAIGELKPEDLIENGFL